MNELALKVLLFALIGYTVVLVFHIMCCSPKILKKMNPDFGEFKIKSLADEHKRDIVYDLMIVGIGFMGYLMLKNM